MQYPSIRIECHSFSLIPPFTIDDKIITNVENIIQPMYNFDERGYFNLTQKRWIRVTFMPSSLTPSERKTIMFHADTFRDINRNRTVDASLRSLYVEYIMRQNNRNPEIERLCQKYIDYNNMCCSSYHRTLEDDILAQCTLCNDGCNIEYFRNKLREQDRDFYSALERDANIINNARRYAASYDWISPVSPNISPVAYSKPKSDIIHSNAYTPNYQKYWLPGEKESTTLLLGAEIEVDCGGKSEEHAKKVLQIMNGEDTWDTEKHIYCVRDGSLIDGLEFPTQPCSLNYHKTLPYKEMFEYLDDNGYKAHDTETCGLHVHINRSFFGDNESECIGKLMYIVEKFNNEFSIIGRRNCRYSKFWGYSGEKCKELYQKGYQLKDKYHAINLLHTDTIEIRAFKGTLKYSTFMNTLEFVSNLATFVKNHTEKDIENMNWSDLYNTFSDELKKYYDERKQIEDKKQKTDTTPVNTPIYGYPRGSRSLLNLDFLAAQFGERDTSNRTAEDLINENAGILGTFHALESIIIGENECTSPLMPIEKTKEEKLKDLKKQLKTERNYMAKIKLQKEICQLQKEIKQEKKRKKKENSNN